MKPGRKPATSSLAQQRIAVLAREVAVLTRLRDALEAARSQARDPYFAPVLQELRPLLGLLLTMPASPSTRTRRCRARCSVMARTSRSASSAAACASSSRSWRGSPSRGCSPRGGQPTPVILDDALVYSDALHRQASAQQVIVFSCRQRAFARLGGHVRRTEPWHADS